MRILHVTTDYRPRIISGIGVYVANLVDAQVRAGDEVFVVTNKIVTNENLREETESAVLWPEIGRFADPRVFSVLLENIDIAFQLAHIDPDRIDVVNVHDYFGSLGAIQWANRNNRPIVFTKHFLDPARPTILRNEFREVTDSWCFAQSDLVTCVSEFLTTSVTKVHPRLTNKIQTIPGSAFTESELSNLPDLPRDPWKIIVAGRVRRIKGWDAALRVIANLDPRFHAVFAGDGDEIELARTFAKELQLEERVYFAGHLERSDLIREYRSSTFGLFLSREEAQGLALSEALAAGCVCVATRVGGIPEQIQDASNGFMVKIDDHESAARILTKLAHDSDEVARVSTNARGRSIVYGWPDVARKTDGACSEVVKDKS